MALKFLNDGYFAGKVGIGVEVPTYTLELQVSQPDENPVVYSQFGGNNGVTGNSFLQIGGARGSAASERYSYLQTLDGAGGFRILSLNPSGGNVGIGNTNPGAPLDVNGNVYVRGTGVLYADTLAGYTSGVITLSASTNFIVPSGNVGIGTTSPDLKLDVTHATAGEYVATFQNTGSNLELKLGVTSTGYLNIQGQQINNSATFNMSLQADGGNVGINTTIPTQKLHVVGNARVTGAYYDSNNSPGTANQVLVSTATGTDWVDGSGSSIIGGPYLPLSAGSSYPLTGTLHGTSTNFSGSGDYAGSMTLGTGASTAEAHLQIGQGRTGNGYSYIDLIGDATYSDYGFRIIRNNNGPNTTSAILHRGTGNLEISANDSASILLKTNGATALTLNNTQNATFAGDVTVDSALLSNQENTDVDTGTETVASVAIATYTAAFFDFVIKKTTNVRSGTVYACHDGTNVEFTETSTQDLGDTSDVTLSVDISGGNMRLRATTTSDNWSIKSLIRAI